MADTAITINDDRVSPLSEQEQAATGFNRKFRVLAADLAASTSGATDTVTLTLGATPANWYIDKAMVNITTAFAGITAATFTVGTTTSVAAIISSTSILTAAILNMAIGVPIFTNTAATATKNVVAIFTAAGTGGPAALTTGVMDIYLRLQDCSRMP